MIYERLLHIYECKFLEMKVLVYFDSYKLVKAKGGSNYVLHKITFYIKLRIT